MPHDNLVPVQLFQIYSRNTKQQICIHLIVLHNFPGKLRLFVHTRVLQSTQVLHVNNKVFIFEQKQGGHGTGKTGNLVLTFSRQGKHREFAKKILKI